MEHSTLLEQLRTVARAASKAIMTVYAKEPVASYKPDESPVTEADEAAEAIIVPALNKLAPDTPIVSEENAASHSVAAPERFFLVDPLDGTKEFLKRDGKGAFTVNIALIEKGVPVLGVVFAPALDRMFAGIVGSGASEFANGAMRAIGIRSVPASGAVAVVSLSHRDERTDTWLAGSNIADIVAMGSSLKFCLVACGEADVYPRFGPTMEWDTAAGDAVLRAAGGRVTHPDGPLLQYGKPNYRNGAFIAHGGL